MNDRQVGVATALVTMAGLIATHVPNYFLDRWTSGGFGFPAWLPTLESGGATWVVYRNGIDIVAPALPVTLAVALGVYVASHRDVAEDYRRLVTAVSLGSIGGVLVPFVVLTLAFLRGGSIDLFGVLMLVAGFLSFVAEVGLPVVLGTLAGAALAHFHAEEMGPSEPVESPDDEDSPPADEGGGQSSQSRQIAIE